MEKCQKCLKSSIKACDAFGTFISFRINNDIEYKSLIGGCSTICFVIITLIYGSYCCYDFFSRKNVEFIFTNKIVQADPSINLTKSEFNLAFGVQYSEDAMPANEDTEKYFEFKMTSIEWIGDNDFYEFPMDFKSCEPSDFYDKVNESFETNVLTGYYCPILNESTNYTLAGLYTDYFFKFIELEVRLSDYGMKNLDEVEKFMHDSPLEMAIYFLDSAIDYESRSEAVPTYINYQYKAIDFEYTKLTEVFISSLEFKNDDNILIDNPKLLIESIFDHSIDSFRYFMSRETSNESLIGKFTIKASPKIVQVSRKYQKFPSFIADFTSLLEEILVLMLLIVNFVERKAVDKKLIEKMLKFRGSKYYDIDYLLNKFHNQKINNNIKDMIEKENLNIERCTNIVSTKKYKMILLNNKNTIKSNTKGDKKTEKSPLKNNCLVNSEEQISNSKDVQSMTSFHFQENKGNNEFLHGEGEEYSEKSKKLPNLKIRVNDDELNRNIHLEGNSLSSKKNSIYYKNEDIINDKEIYGETIEKKREIEKDNGIQSLGICNMLCASLCFWACSKQNKRNKAFTVAENKIHYYLDIYTYIKKMQEIDLLKYCLFNEDQLILFKFLSKPPVKMGNCGIYKEFEEQQINYQKLDKKEVDILVNSYHTITKKSDITFEDLKLLRLVKAEIDFLE